MNESLPGRPRLPAVAASVERPYLALNMVASVDGRTAVNGTPQGLTSARDRRRMLELRAEADVVLHGAGTVRADPVSARVPTDLAERRVSAGRPAQPLGAIVTASGELPAEHRYYRSATRIYVTSDRPVRVSGPNVEVRRVADVAAVVRDLAAGGARRIVCEGGPTLNAALLAGGLVDEVFLTVVPRLVGGPSPLTLVTSGAFPTIELDLRAADQVEGELYLRYAVLRP